MEIFLGILIPFIGTTLGAACVLFMKKTLRKMVGMLVVAASIVSMVSVQDVSASQTTQTSYETMEEPILQEDMSDDELVEGIIAESISYILVICKNNKMIIHFRNNPSQSFILHRLKLHNIAILHRFGFCCIHDLLN